MVAGAVAAEPTGLGGVGVGWRPEISGVVTGRAGLGFSEVVAESLHPSRARTLPRPLTELRERGVALVPHGVRLSLGGAEPVDGARVTHLAECAAALGAPLVSEHIAFVRADGREAGHLLPVPRTRAALDALAANVARLQAELDVPVALEPIAALLDWPEDELSEGEFLRALLDRTGALLLLDVANVHANAVNRGVDPLAALDALPLDRIGYVHVAGGSVHADDPLRLYHDTHTDPVPAPVLALLAALCERLPAPPPVLLERDGHYPPAAQLEAELDAVAAVVGSPPDTSTGPGAPASRDLRARESGPACPRVEAQVPASRGPGTCESGDRVPVTSPGPTSAGLSERQDALVAALVGGGSRPAGFDPDRLEATRRALLRKRAGEVAKVWPLLAASLGPDHAATFAAHAAGRPPVGALRDGWDLARALRAAGRLAPGAAAELAEREAAFRYDGAGVPRPRLTRTVRTLVRRLATHAQDG